MTYSRKIRKAVSLGCFVTLIAPKEFCLKILFNDDARDYLN